MTDKPKVGKLNLDKKKTSDSDFSITPNQLSELSKVIKNLSISKLSKSIFLQ